MRERVGHGEVGRNGLERDGGGAGRRFGAWLPGEWSAAEESSAEEPAAEEPAAEEPAAERSSAEQASAEQAGGEQSAGGGPVQRARPARPSGWRVARRRGTGPRPVRPGSVAAAVRPPEVPRPLGPTTRYPTPWPPGSVGPRLLRRSGPCAAHRGRLRPGTGLRRAVAGAALVVASAAAVVVLGLLAGVGVPSGTSVASSVAPPAPVVVTVEPGETVWEVAARVAPGLSGAERAALAERIVTDNQLVSVRPEPGRVLRVVAG